MLDTRISRRAALLGAGVTVAWLSSPARALLQAATRVPVPAFVDDLISKMTLEEKAGQLSLMASAWGPSAAAALNPPSNSNFPQQLEETRQGQLTGIFNGNGARMARIMQNVAVKELRMKIPLIFAADIIHGHRTIFPVPLAEVASFEPELARRTAEVAAFEAAGAGIDWNFAPMVDVARDQRWGRGVEGGGEDVLLGNLFAAARVQGFQGTNLKSNEHFLATAKHFAAYGAAEAGLDYNTVDMSERTLREVYLPPYKAALDAGALSVMASFNEISGIPATGNRWLMRDVLRGEWKFDGFVVSDYTGDEEMIAHGYAKDGRDAARIALLAGVDMSMQSGLYRKHLPELVRAGEVPEAVLNESVRKVLAMKAMLGLFEDPFRRIDEKREQSRSMLPRNRALAREAGRKSIVLLKNDNDLLPLPKSGKKIALIGPFAAGQHDLVGPWVVYGTDEKAVDLATGVRAAVADKNSIIIAEGSEVEKPIAGGIEQAVAAAQQADIIVLAIGEAQGMSGEAQSRTEIVVPKPQQDLAEAVAKARQADRGRAEARPSAGARRRGGERSGNSGDLVPGNGDRSLDRRRPVRRLQPIRPPAGELPAALGPAALLLRAQAHGPSQCRSDAGELQGAFPRHHQQRALSVRSRPDLRQDRLQQLHHQCPDHGHERRDHGDGADHEQRPSYRRGSRPALRPRPRREHHAAGPRAEGVPQDQAGAGTVGSGELHDQAGQPAVLRRQRSSSGRARHVRRVDRAVSRSGGP